MKSKGTYLISKTNTATKHDPTDDEHGKILSRSVKNRTDYEEYSGNQHGQSPSEPSSGVGGEESGGQTGKVERRSEQLEALIVILAVITVFIFQCLPVNHWEELLQERFHRRHSTWKTKEKLINFFLKNKKFGQPNKGKIVISKLFKLLNELLNIQYK